MPLNNDMNKPDNKVKWLGIPGTIYLIQKAAGGGLVA